MGIVVSRRWSRRHFLLAIVTLVTIYLWSQQAHGPHIVQPADVLTSTSDSRSSGALSSRDVQAMCRKHQFAAFPRARKVYDLFLISTELDWLEIRLHTLSPYVDYFVIIEGTRTFTGIAKQPYLDENWDRFKPYHDKIIHRVVEDPGDLVGLRTWDHEDYMRNALFDHVFKDLKDTPQEAHLEDVLIVSDIDEIPRPETISLLRHCNFPARLTLRSQFYYYSFQWKHRGEDWAHPQATLFRGLNGGTISPKDLRNGEGDPGWFYLGHFWTWWEKAELYNAGWHCSSCFASIGELHNKMQSFSHSGWNTEDNRNQGILLERVRNGQDLFGRETEIYDRIENNRDIPSHVAENRDKFAYILDRDGPDAGFVDIQHNN